MMKAIQYTAFGDSSVIKLSEVNVPDLKEDEVLIKVIATTVNPFDIKVRKGQMQKLMPVELPYIPGSDAAGIIEAVGTKVNRLKAGDKVFATASGGSYAEFLNVTEQLVALKPDSLSYEEAASLAVPLSTASTILMEAVKIQSGQKILVHGAAGAVGSVVLQMAKAMGAYVVATASGNGIALAKKHGADEVIDYKNQDFTELAKDMDVVGDTVGGETQSKSYKILKKGGSLLSIVSQPSPEMAKAFDVIGEFVFSKPSYRKLEWSGALVVNGKIKPGIAKVMTLNQAAEAQDLSSAGGLNGKIVLLIG